MVWQGAGGMPPMYFVVDAGRSGHLLMLYQEGSGGTWLRASYRAELSTGHTFSPTVLGYSAIYDPASPYKIIDLTTNEQTYWDSPFSL